MDYSYSASYYTPNPLYPPDVSPTYLATVPNSTQASIDVHLPVADAEVWFEGTRATQTGVERVFTSLPLTPGVRYTYRVRARWTEAGRAVEQTRAIEVQAGQQAVLDFTAPPGENLPRPKRG